MYFERIKEIREENDLTQQTIADILKVSRSTYASWEVNINTIPLENLNTLCNYYNVSMDYIVNGKKDAYVVDKIEKLDKIEIGKRLKKIRKKMKYTQKDLAKVLGISSSLISAYESGTSLITTLFLFEIAKLSNTSIDWICGRIYTEIDKNDTKYIYTIVGRNIARIRKKRGLSKSDLADLTHYSETFIENIESYNYRNCDLEFLYIISKKLNVSITELFKGLED